MSVAAPHVEGHVSRGFEAVREVFVENFNRRGELGGAVCAYHRGDKVVDLWGGTAIRTLASHGRGTRWCSCGRRARGSPL
jgi:hypothetical protein